MVGRLEMALFGLHDAPWRLIMAAPPSHAATVAVILGEDSRLFEQKCCIIDVYNGRNSIELFFN